MTDKETLDDQMKSGQMEGKQLDGCLMVDNQMDSGKKGDEGQSDCQKYDGQQRMSRGKSDFEQLNEQQMDEKMILK